MIKILLLMLLCHVIDDFVLQPICLSKLKQKSWWEKQEGFEPLYKDDYKMALFIHSMSWAIMIMLPIMFLIPTINQTLLFFMVFLNIIIHYGVDDMKANEHEINLIKDQTIHLIQVILTFIICA